MVLELSDSGRVVNGDREGSSNHKEHHGVLRNRAVKRREKSGARAMATGSSDDGDDLDMEMHLDVAVNGARKRELTFQDMYEDQNLFDDDNEDDDSDWEPVEKFVDFQQWFCTNCTMLNLENLEHCNMCGEHKNSGILKLGFLASQFSQYVGTDNSTEEKKQRRKDAKSSKASSSNSSTVVGFDERMLLHDEVEIKSHPHPERPDRLRAIAAGLAAVGLFPGKCYPITAREITKEELLTVHSLEHVQTVDVTGLIFASYFTPDTYANEHSAQAARLAAGLCADLASEIFCGRAKNGFALIRPPGHHAGVKHAMGFCLHNNAAVAALAAQAAGAKKVLIVDWDVHHGNGTQEIFEQNKSVLYISLHRHEGGKFYPGTGATIEVGSGGAEGYCVNIPWSCGGVGDNDYIFAFQNIVLPIASNFAPDFTIISAGFDAARGDPLGGCDVTPTGYALMTELLYNLCDGRLLVILEGGYNLRSISSSAAEVVKVLLGERPSSESCNTVPSRAGLETVLDVLKFQKNFWPSLQSRIATLESQLSAQSTKSMKEMRKIRRKHVPVWWKWGGKSLLMYHVLGRRFHLKRKGR